MGIFTPHIYRSGLPVTVITDCLDENAKGRLLTRLAVLFPNSHHVFVGLNDEYKAALQVVDTIDALGGEPGIILANVARRNGHGKKWPNGTPFGVLKVGQTIIFATIGGAILAMVSKLLGHDHVVEVLDIPTAMPILSSDPDHIQHVVNTQYRSYEFLPLAAAAYLNGVDLRCSNTNLAELQRIEGNVVLEQDCFGNLKLSANPADFNFVPGSKVQLDINGKTQEFTCYERLKDIPNGVLALTIGSSGIGYSGELRFLELMVQGGNAADILKLKVGDPIELAA